MTTLDADQAAKPIKVQVVPVEQAPVERRSNPATFVPSTVPAPILPLSNKRIHAVVSVAQVNTGQTGIVYLCKDQAAALNVAAGNYVGGAAAAVGPGTFELVGTGEWWLVSTGPSNYLVGVIGEYDT